MVESTALEMRRAGNRTVGSNPTLSASSSRSEAAAKIRNPEAMLMRSANVDGLGHARMAWKVWVHLNRQLNDAASATGHWNRFW